MKLPKSLPLVSVCVLAGAWSGPGAAAETLFRDLPPGVVLESSTEALPAQAQALGQKLGGKIERVAYSILRVHGRAIKVNTLTAVDEASARAVYEAIAQTKSQASFCARQDRLVVEYPGKDVDAAFATKTSYELGLLPKPTSLRYRVTAEIAAVEKADYMACTPLFNLFLALPGGPNPGTQDQIGELAQRFQFGRTVALRNPKLDNGAATHQFQPPATEAKEVGAAVAYSFPPLPARNGVPFVTALIAITVDGTGFRASAPPPSADLTAATPFWPASDPKVVALARRITDGRSSHAAKAMAILEWLAPGRNLKNSGPTGSRWGTAKVLEQGFGRCWDFSDCFVTLARAAGVPSRQVAGWLHCSAGHVWAEYYREGQGWQQVDPTGGGKLPCGIYHVPYFTSDDGGMPVLYVGMPKIECLPLK